MEKRTIQKYVKQHPEISYVGIEWDLTRPDYKKERKCLLNSIEEIQQCIFWLVEFLKQNKTFVNVNSSYGLKYYVENYFGKYISNGSFVTAIKMMGYKYREFRGDPNLYLSFNKRWSRKYLEENFKR